MTESLKDILKPIRQKAQEAEGIEKAIYDELLRKIELAFKGVKGVTRQDVIDEIERQRGDTRALLEQTKRQVEDLDKGPGYVHWGDET